MKSFAAIALVLTALATATACTDVEHTVQALRAEGFTGIFVHGYEPFTCLNDEAYATSFTATSRQGVRVQGTVCCTTAGKCRVIQ